MKKKLYYLSFMVVIALAGCNGLSKMVKNASMIKYEVTPNPLELKGDSVAITIKATYPEKYFAKKVNATVTPYIKTSDGTEHNFKDIVISGEKADSGATKI